MSYYFLLHCTPKYPVTHRTAPPKADSLLCTPALALGIFDQGFY